MCLRHQLGQQIGTGVSLSRFKNYLKICIHRESSVLRYSSDAVPLRLAQLVNLLLLFPGFDN